MSFKILHTGDIHLGDLAGPTKDGENLRRMDTLACMDAIVLHAQNEVPDITVIAGDLFNRSRVWADTALEDVNDAISRFLRPLCQHSHAVVLLFGTENHDNPRAFDVIKKATGDLKNLHIYTHPTVDTIHIEMRDPDFVLQAMGVKTACDGVKGYYPSFDITPPHLVSGCVTDAGIFSPYDLHRYFGDGNEGEYTHKDLCV